MRVARSRELVAQGRPAAVVARIAGISRQAIYRQHSVRAVQLTALLPMLLLTAVVAVMVSTGSPGDADIGAGLLGIVVVFGLPAALAAAVAASRARQRP